MSFKTLEVSSLLYKVTCNNISWSCGVSLYHNVLISFYALRDLFYYLFFSIFHLLLQERKRKSYYCQSEVKLKCFTVLRGLVRFSVCFICAWCIISRVFYVCLCVSHTINPVRITNVHFMDFRSFPQREWDKERETERRVKDMRVRSRFHS